MELHITEKIRLLQEQIDDLRSQFPAHSIPTAMIIKLDELEEERDYWIIQLGLEKDRNIEQSEG